MNRRWDSFENSVNIIESNCQFLLTLNLCPFLNVQNKTVPNEGEPIVVATEQYSTVGWMHLVIQGSGPLLSQ